jgi:hypothetical protein
VDSVFEVYGALPAKRGMSSATVVEALDVLEDRVRELHSGIPALAIEQPGLQACPERFREGAVVRVADAGERGQQPGFAGPFGEGPAGELVAVVAGDNAAGRGPAGATALCQPRQGSPSVTPPARDRTARSSLRHGGVRRPARLVFRYASPRNWGMIRMSVKAGQAQPGSWLPSGHGPSTGVAAFCSRRFYLLLRKR